MGTVSPPGPPVGFPPIRAVSCQMSFVVSEPAEIVLQVVAARSAGPTDSEDLEIRTDGVPPRSVAELRDQGGSRMHVVHSLPGR